MKNYSSERFGGEIGDRESIRRGEERGGEGETKYGNGGMTGWTRDVYIYIL